MQVVYLDTIEARRKVLQPQMTILEKSFKFFSCEALAYRDYLCVMDGSTVVGMACIVRRSIRADNAKGLAFLTVHPAHRNKGIAKMLVESLFKLCAEEKTDIANTAYSEDGKKWLQPLMAAAAARFPSVRLYER